MYCCFTSRTDALLGLHTTRACPTCFALLHRRSGTLARLLRTAILLHLPSPFAVAGTHLLEAMHPACKLTPISCSARLPPPLAFGTLLRCPAGCFFSGRPRLPPRRAQPPLAPGLHGPVASAPAAVPLLFSVFFSSVFREWSCSRKLPVSVASRRLHVSAAAKQAALPTAACGIHQHDIICTSRGSVSASITASISGACAPPPPLLPCSFWHGFHASFL